MRLHVSVPAAVKPHVKHRKREPEGVHGQLEGCNKKLRPKAVLKNTAALWQRYRRYRVTGFYYRVLVDPPQGGAQEIPESHHAQVISVDNSVDFRYFTKGCRIMRCRENRFPL